MKGSPSWICSFFYNEIDFKDRMSFLPGQFYSGLVVYPTYNPLVLQMEQYDPKEENIVFRIKTFQSGLTPHYPIKSLSLSRDEFLFTYRGKIRPVIILGYVESDWLKEDRAEKIYLCAPIFTFKDRHPQQTVLKVQALTDPSLFYLPPDLEGISAESAVRFEMIQPIMKGGLQPLMSRTKERKPFILSEDAYQYFFCHLSNFLCGVPHDSDVDELIREYQKELLAASSAV